MQTKHIEISMIIKRDNDDIEIIADAEIHYYIDRAYGADADGNRAVSRTFVQDVRDFHACVFPSCEDFILTKDEQDIAEEMLVDKFYMD